MPYSAKNGNMKPYPAPKVPKSTTKPAKANNNTKRMGKKK